MYLNKTLSDKNLINCVKDYAQIYDNANAEFKNVQLKEDCWSRVAEQLHLEVETCKKRWRALRERYTREVRRVLLTNESSSWPYFDCMKFLDPWIKLRSVDVASKTEVKSEDRIESLLTLETEIMEREEDEEGEEPNFIVVAQESPLPATPVSRPAKRRVTSYSPMQAETTRTHPSDTVNEDKSFSDSVCLTLTKFSRLHNIQAKAEIYKVLQKFVEIEER